jgi:hypothetical protein
VPIERHRRRPPRVCAACHRLLGPADHALRAPGRVFFCGAPDRPECRAAFLAALGRPPEVPR